MNDLTDGSGFRCVDVHGDTGIGDFVTLVFSFVRNSRL